MKGSTFLKPLEFRLETPFEVANQGESVNGITKVINHSDQNVKLDKLVTILAIGTIKKVQLKDKNAFKTIQEIVLSENLSLAPKEEKEFSWEFKLTEDAPITDKQISPYLLYGSSNDPFECGQLQLQVEMKPILKFFLETFTNFHRFQAKQIKYKKGMVSVKLAPPQSREMSSVVALNVCLSHKLNVLNVEYNFTVKKLESVSMTDALVQKKKKTFTQALEKNEYEEFGSFSYDKIKKAIGEILKNVIPKLYF